MERSGGKWNKNPQKWKEVEHLLIGEYEHSIDTKGRLIMPSKLKEDIGEKFVITQGLDGCLFVYSRKRMEKLRRKIKNISTYK